MANLSSSPHDIIHFNVGGKRFSTSRQTLTWNPDTFFTSLLSGRISSHKDENGAIFIDRDPKLFSVILNFLRTKELHLRNVDLSALRHEAEFYGIAALVQRLTLCEDLEHSSCGDVLFHAYFQPPTPPMRDTASARQSIVSVDGPNGARTSQSQSGDSRPYAHLRQASQGSSQFLQDCLEANAARQNASQAGIGDVLPSLGQGNDSGKFYGQKLDKTKDKGFRFDPRRVTMVRGHQNWICASYPHFVCCFRMKDSTGWHLVWSSQYMDAQVERIALNAKVMSSNQDNLNNKMVAASSGSLVWLWSVSDEGESRQIGVFNLHVCVDNLFFIGSQLVALSCTGKVGVWHSMSQHWQIQDVVPITSYDTAGSFLLLGCENGSIYYIDMQKFPLRMKDNDLLVTELYRDPACDNNMVTALSVYLTPKTTLSGNWIEIAYGTSSGTVRVIVQHPETVGHGPQLFQTFTVHCSPVTKVMLSEKHLVSVCSEYNHVRTWNVTRFRGMISTQPGSMPLASFKIVSLDDVSPETSYSAGNDFGPFGEQDDKQLFFQKVVSDTDKLFVRLSSSGQRVCVIRSVDGSNISSFCVHECEGTSRMSSCLRRYLFTGHANGSVQMWDLTTALDLYNKQEEKTARKDGGPSAEELINLLEHVDLSSSRCSTPCISPATSIFMNQISSACGSLRTRKRHQMAANGASGGVCGGSSDSSPEKEIAAACKLDYADGIVSPESAEHNQRSQNDSANNFEKHDKGNWV